MKIPFALRIHDQRMVDPTEVTKGQSCGCICPDDDCKGELIAKQGKKNEWHFAHKAGADCSSGIESALHRMAKQMVLERSQIWVHEHSIHRQIHGSHDDVDGGYCWKESLKVEICASGLKTLSNCVEEKKNWYSRIASQVVTATAIAVIEAWLSASFLADVTVAFLDASRCQASGRW